MKMQGDLRAKAMQAAQDVFEEQSAALKKEEPDE
jgi:hypothetical protein